MKRLQTRLLHHAIDSVSKFLSNFEYGASLILYCYAFFFTCFHINSFIDLLESQFKLEESNPTLALQSGLLDSIEMSFSLPVYAKAMACASL